MNPYERKVTPGFLLKFTLPTMIMMVFNSFYTMVDGGFVANFAGTGALSATNIVYPVVNLVFAVGIMLATGGSAIVGKQMGEENAEGARQSFTLIVMCGALFGMVLTLICCLFTEQIVWALGANEAIFAYCYDYAFFMGLFIPFAVLQVLFQFFFVTTGKPNLGLLATVLGGVSNIIFDYLFIVPLQMGIKGAALATGIGFLIPALIGIFYFAFRKKGMLRFTRPVFQAKILLGACANGLSEMVSNLSVAVTTLLFNRMMMKYLGEDGVAALTIVFYAQFLFTAIFLGYTSGVAPLFSYHYGAKNKKRLKQLFRCSLIFVTLSCAAAYGLSLLLSDTVVGIFAREGSNVYELACHGMSLFAIGFLFMGLNIFASGMFTALSNGKISALLSFLRTFVFIIAAILILTRLLEANGIWLSIPAAEFLAVLVSGGCMGIMRKRYGY